MLSQARLVANGPYYIAYIPNLTQGVMLQPFLDYAFGFRRGTNAGQPPDNAGPRAELPIPYNGIPEGRDDDLRPDEPNRNQPGPRMLVRGRSDGTRQAFFAPRTISADFETATAVYPGDQVRVSGVKVGTIESIQPEGTQTRMTFSVDRNVAIPADAKAVIVAQNLVAARYVQLAPAHRNSGPTMADNAEIPMDRTAVPVEWDEVKTQLNRLATELGPKGGVSGTSAARIIDSAADALAGNGKKLRQTPTQMSGGGRMIANGSGNIVEIIKSLQTFIATLRDSASQIVQFQGRLATLSSVLDGSRSDLDGALRNVSDVVGEVQRFVKGTRDQAAEQIQLLADVTQNVVDHQKDLEQILHVGPTAVANTLNMFDPRDGGATGIFTLTNFSNPVQFFCGAIGSIGRVAPPHRRRRNCARSTLDPLCAR